MRLSSTRIEQTINQIGPHVVAIANDHPVAEKLYETFGDHTFFVDEDGLEVVEPTTSSQADTEAGELVKLATWNDAAQTTLTVHPPEATGIIITFDSEDSHKVDRAGENSFPASDPTSHSGITGDDE